MTCKVIDDKNKPIRILECETNNVFSLENKEEALKFCDALNVTLNYVNELIDEKLELKKENEQLKEIINQIENSEKNLKQSILKRIDDYIWRWEDEGTPVDGEMKQLKDDIVRGYLND